MAFMSLRNRSLRSAAIVSGFLACAGCAPHTPQTLARTTIYAPNAALRVQVATTAEQKEKGLMFVRALPRHTGMLFVYDRMGRHNFWMKNTFVPLDIVFIDSHRTVSKVATLPAAGGKNIADDDIPRAPGYAHYVLEIPAHEAVADGIVAGAQLRGF